MGVLKVWDETSQQYIPVRSPAGGGGDYLPLTGGTLTGPLGVPEIGTGNPAMVMVGTATSPAVNAVSASLAYPADIAAGDLLIALSCARTGSASGQYASARDGFEIFPGLAQDSHIGNYAAATYGGTWYYKIADGTEGGTTLTFTWDSSAYHRLFLLVVRNAKDPAVTPVEIYDNGLNPDVAAGAVTWSTGGFMFAPALTFDNYLGGSNFPSPSTDWGTTILDTGNQGNDPGYASGIVAQKAVPAGGNPAVDFTYPGGADGYATGLLLVPGGATAPVELLNGIDMNDQSITGLPEPVNASDAASKAYVDSGGSGNPVLALPTADPVPPGTPAGTVIVRY